MEDRLSNILESGFEVWKKNLILCVPFLLEMVALAVLYVGFFAFAMLAAILMFIFAPGYMVSFFENAFSANGMPSTAFILVFGGLALLVFLLELLVNSFFSAGVIGMAKNSIETGRARLGDMLVYGRRDLWHLFSANLILFMVLLLGVLVIAVVSVGALLLLRSYSEVIVWIIAALDAFFMLAYLLAASIVFSPLPYLVVVESVGAIDALRKTYHFFLENKFEVTLMWLISFGVGVVIGLLQLAAGFVFSAVPLLGVFLRLGFNMLMAVVLAFTLYPLMTCWWTRLYVDLRSKPKAA